MLILIYLACICNFTANGSQSLAITDSSAEYLITPVDGDESQYICTSSLPTAHSSDQLHRAVSQRWRWSEGDVIFGLSAYNAIRGTGQRNSATVVAHAVVAEA